MMIGDDDEYKGNLKMEAKKLKKSKKNLNLT